MKHYYALYAPYGIRAAYGPAHGPTVHIFDTPLARDAWVAEDRELKREPCTSAEAARYRDERLDVSHTEV